MTDTSMTTVSNMDTAIETEGCTDAGIRIYLHELVVSQCDSIYPGGEGEIAYRAPQKFKVLWAVHRIFIIYVTSIIYVIFWSDRRDSRVSAGNWIPVHTIHTMSSMVFNNHPL